MKIIEPSFVLSTPYSSGGLTYQDGVRLLRFVEQQGRISHRSESKQCLDSWQKFIHAVVIGHGDWSITEHSSITATFRIDRGVTHEAVRHRLFAFTQESTRFVRYKGTGTATGTGNMEFVQPEGIDASSGSSGSIVAWQTAMEFAEKSYLVLLEQGLRPQEARSVLPNSLAATIAVTGNLRNWRHFFLMRTSRETHPDFRRITIPMLKEFQKVVPFLYDDIEPNQRQVDNLKKAR